MRRILAMVIIAVLSNPSPIWAQPITPADGSEAERQLSREEWLAVNDEVSRLYLRGEFAKAEPLAREALDKAESSFGESDSTTLTSAARMADIYARLDRHEEAEELYIQTVDIRRFILGDEHVDTLRSKNDLAFFYANWGGRDSEALYIEVIEARKRTLGQNHPSTLNSISGLAALYQATGRYDESETLFKQAISGLELALGKDDQDTLSAVFNLANLKLSQRRYAEAETLMRRSHIGFTDLLGESHIYSIITGVALGKLYNELDRLDEAAEILTHSLSLAEASLGENHSTTISVVSQLAETYRLMWRFEEALPLFVKAADASERVFGPENPKTVWHLRDLGRLYLFLGRYHDAEEALLRSQQAYEQLNGVPVASEIAVLLGEVYDNLHYYDLAEEWLRKSLSVDEEMLGIDHPDSIYALSALARVYENQEKFESAEKFYSRAFRSSEKNFGELHVMTLVSASDLAGHHLAKGAYGKATSMYFDIVSKVEFFGGPEHTNTAYVYYNYGLALEAEDHPSSAIILLWKKAVNILQLRRSLLSKYDNDAHSNFVSAHVHIYENLQALLIEAGRFAEAEQVGRMLKEQEYFEFIRRRTADGEDPRASRSELTSIEAEWETQMSSWSKRPNRIAAELAVLKTKRRGGEELTSLEQTQLDDLQTRYDVAYTEYKTRIDDWLVSVSELSDDAIQREAEELQSRYHDDLQLEIEEIGADVAALQLVAFEDSTHAFLITPGAFKHMELPVARTELFQAIYAARRAVQPDPQTGELDPDAKLKLQALHEVLMAPIEQELADAGTETLMLNLQGAIRYVPFAALYDGESYLTERYKLAMFTPAARTPYEAADELSEATGFGVAMAHAPFKALPSVTRELASILGTEAEPGILTGPSYLDTAFTKDVLKSELEEERPILHIASHFTMRPGNDSNSFLLLGDGTKLTLAEINETAALRFKGVELLTLSACSTALSTEGSFGVDSGTGVEVEGFGVLAQRKGAKAVIASLWDVNDSSTADLMTEMYRNLANGDLNKAEALQAAQKAMLASTDKNHPYYWAPFILMGNWK